MTGFVRRVGARLRDADRSLDSRLRLRARRRADDGFVLLESVMTISLITVIMSAIASFFINGVVSTDTQRAKQIATQVATSAVETIRGMAHPSQVFAGHDSSSVNNQFVTGSANDTVRPWIDTMTPAVDETAASGEGITATIPTVPVTQVVNNRAYSVNSFVGWCVVNGSEECRPGSGGIAYLRAVVAVTWHGNQCTSSTCTYVTGTLLSAGDDPAFSLKQPPPPLPMLNTPPDQTAVVGVAVSLDLQPFVQTGTGVPSFTWIKDSGSLPAGLSLSPDGIISGTPTTAVSGLSVTVQVTDAFTRTDSTTFKWTVLQAIVVTPPGDQVGIWSAPITPLVLTAAGGTGTGYTWSDSGTTLPPGLTLATVSGKGQISGTPTTVGIYSVRLSVKDSTNTYAGTVTFTWTVSYPPLAATTPGTQTSTVGTAISPLQLAVTGGSGSYVWSDGGSTLPAGLTLSSTGRITGTPTATGSGSVSLRVTDTVTGNLQTVTFLWTVVQRPTITAPANQSTTAGATIDALQLTSSCPNSPCSYTLNNGPSGLTISAAGVVTGTVPGPAQTFSAVTITIRDNAGATATSTAFTWRVNSPLTMGSPGTQLITAGAADSLDVSPLAGGGTTPYSYSASGLPSWLTLNPSTGVMTGTAPGAKSVTNGITVSVTDSGGATTTSAPFRWIVTNLAIAVPDMVTVKSRSASIDLDNYATRGTAPYTFTIVNKPTWLSYNTTTHILSGTAPSSTGTTSGITVTVTDSDGVVVTSAPFSWRVVSSSSLVWSTVPAQLSRPDVPATNLDVKPLVTNDVAPFSATGLPPGLTINTTTGVISGTPTTRGAYRVTVSATDSLGALVPSVPFVWTVTDLAWSTIPATSGPRNVVVSFDVSPYDSGGLPAFTYTATGLPTGLAINAATGIISGTPTTRTTYTVAITVTDGTGAAVTSASFTWRVT